MGTKTLDETYGAEERPPTISDASVKAVCRTVLASLLLGLVGGLIFEAMRIRPQDATSILGGAAGLFAMMFVLGGAVWAALKEDGKL